MMIRKIRMENFRGFRDKTINSMDKTVVLLFAANGVGKTTTIVKRIQRTFGVKPENDKRIQKAHHCKKL